ncbi:actin monomer binding protein-like protein [Lepidopterella palustris CBS 459.81]|uniref:Actin monomer binding protein-like protein n=1 Tax=Lepidopterella palustris CBS 459.81 TaxID=1314670 RepID=A0A8E2EBS1_9PEZI|nr:actin monomer binding protein-like protein [Lepidopterella palustris CBS 459.81]
MQSGISASADLHAAFQTLLSTPTQRGLLATISNEAIVPGPTLPSTGSFLSDLSNLAAHLTSTAALYILLRRADAPSSSAPSTGTFVAITYVPNAAPVRQKMLFASTRLTLLRELGSENFGETLFVTEAEELSASGWARHEAHGEAAAPLTQEERDLEGIKEAEALESRGTGGKGLVNGGRIKMEAGHGVVEAVVALGRGEGGNLVQLNLDPQTESLHLTSVSTVTPFTLSSALSPTEPRFSFYRHITPDAPILFISTCPSSSKIRERMLYAASRNSVIQIAQTQAGLAIAKKIEASNPDEVTEQVVEDEFRVPEAEVPAKTGFARPKRPGKR